MRRHMLLLAALAVSASAAATAESADHFTFRDASFLPDSRAVPEAQAFVAEAFPPGLPLATAEHRAEAAEMRCRPARDGGLACLYSTPQGAEGGLIGEDAWMLHLAPGPGGALAKADLTRRFIGPGPPNPQ